MDMRPSNQKYRDSKKAEKERKAAAKRKAEDPSGQYEIKHQMRVPYLLNGSERLPTETTRVKGKRNRDATVDALKSGGARVISVRRTNWFS